MNAVIVVVLAVVLFGVIIMFNLQNGKMKRARKSQSAAQREFGRAKAEARVYAKELKKLLGGLNKNELSELRNRIVSDRMEAESAKESSQREGTIIAYRHIVDDIDVEMVSKMS
uniref:Uncharacterized protein n=1 Tax=uncultured Alphaproteobacteria bacterium TaxID=91750 RepID=A0A6G8F232_9PROT|nr:hypothetical protein PlAlph_0610 [uncultured Alphaproteobacteria bacterium]